jgi:hypothetical protein
MATNDNEKTETETLAKNSGNPNKKAMPSPAPTDAKPVEGTSMSLDVKNLEILDFKDLKTTWSLLLDKNRLDAENNLLKVTVRINKLDPIAELALAQIKKQFQTDETKLRDRIAQLGLGTALDRVIKRINSLRISENKRVILAAVYPHLLAEKLKSSKEGEYEWAFNEAIKKEVEDDLGFTDSILFALESNEGPLAIFSKEVVKLVGAKHRISFTDDNVLRDLIAHQVRAAL